MNNKEMSIAPQLEIIRLGNDDDFLKSYETEDDETVVVPLY